MPVTTSEFISGFSPQNIPGLTLWLDAADSNTVTLSGTTVTQWRDKSANAYTGIFTAGRNFTYASNIQNGRNCVQTATGQSMIVSNVVMSPFMSIFNVYYLINQAAGSPFIEHGPNANTNDGFYFFKNSSGTWFALYRNGSQVPYSDTVAATSNTWALIAGISPDPASNSRMTTYVNGTRQGVGATTFTSGSNTGSNLFINGRNNTDGFSVAAYLAEIILYNQALTADNRRRVEGYLMRKWGLLSLLPDASVYKRLPPFQRPFNPLDVSGCALWLDAGDFQTLTLSGSNVTRWRDKSGLSTDASSVGVTLPVYQSNSSSGLPSVSFLGNNDAMLVNSNFNMTTFPSLCYFMVIRPGSTQPNTVNAGILSTDTATLFGRSLAFGAGNWQQEYYDGFTNITPYTANAWTVVSLQFVSTTSATMSVNGTVFPATANAATRNNTTGLKIGSYNSDTGYAAFNANFETSEILVYGANLSTQERQQIELYLAQKWGLRSSLTPTLYSTITSSFDPTTISNCILWLDASDSSSFTLSGSNLATITDKSPTAKTVTINSAPTYSNAAFNSRPGFVFASGNRLSAPTTALGTTMTLIGVYRVTVNANSVPLAVGLSGSGNETGLGYNSGGFYMNYDFGIADSLNRTFTTSNIDVLHIGVKTSSNVTSFINGIPGNSLASTYSNANTTINLGGGSFPFVGVLAEALAYSRPLTTIERYQIELYLSQKWGLRIDPPIANPLRSYSSLAPVFNPSLLVGCSMWHDAADFGTLTLSGSNVSQWNDKSGNANHFVQATASARPTHAATTSTRFPAIYFATDTLFMSSTSNNPVTGNASRTLFMIVYSADSSNRFTAGTGSHSSASPPNTFGIDMNNGANILYAPYVYTAADNTFAVTLTGMQCLYAYYDSAVSQVGGGYGFTGFTTKNTTLNTATTTWRIGRRVDGAAAVRGYLCEFILYNSALTAPLRRVVEAYLARKWNIPLPTTHPYYTTPV